jgi:hypothetical protein
MKPWSTRTIVIASVLVLPPAAIVVASPSVREEIRSLNACRQLASAGIRPIADDRKHRFLGKVQEYTALCRGGDKALAYRNTPWTDWSTYWGAGDSSSLSRSLTTGHLSRDSRGIDGALIDLEYERMEMLKFNLFEQNTFEEYVKGRNGVPGRSLKVWPQMRLPANDPNMKNVDVAADGSQICKGDLIRWRNETGLCNDIKNPLMGSTNTEFARNVQFEETFPRMGLTQLTKNRHGDRLDLLRPDPQVISRELLTRPQSDPSRCQNGMASGPDAHCDYIKAPFFNVIAAFWIQFMTHDWFSHLDEGVNDSKAPLMGMGCTTTRENNVERPLTPDEVKTLGCRPNDKMDPSRYAQTSAPPTFQADGQSYMARAPKTTANTNTAWWDASQIYGYSDRSNARVKRDPNDHAKLLMVQIPGRTAEGDRQGYLPVFAAGDPINPEWAGQEAVAFPDNWSIGTSFLHNVFSREHNQFVEEFRRRAAAHPDDDSGLRNPSDPDRIIRMKDVSDEELFQAARLTVAAEIAKIHTIEWTTQLLYDEVLYRGMNANWSGLIRADNDVSRALDHVAVDIKGKSIRESDQTSWYGVFASGAGIFGLGSHKYTGKPGFLGFDPQGKDTWSLKNPDDVNGGINHFGSPFNFPEEFITVYRLHPLVPDLLDYRDYRTPNQIQKEIPVISTFRAGATPAEESNGLSNWAVTMGRQRLGTLTLGNSPLFLQNIPMPRINSETKTIDVPALDLIRDRERGVPRFNEFRRQYGLKTLTTFDDFINQRLDPVKDSAELNRQKNYVAKMRAIYGQHRCDDSKVITEAQDFDGKPITDCLGYPDGSMVDNIEDLDTVVGWLAESTRPHGYAISETQFTVFIINASRRLFSDRFFTSSFRPEFYTNLGVEWVNNNGPTGIVMEQGTPNGHQEVVSPMKRVLLRTMPELKDELSTVVNAYDPWARDRGNYYSLQWTPRKGAESDPAFKKK